RKESRVQAFQTLFQLEMKDSDLTINEAISFIKDDNPDLDFEFIHWLVSGVKDHEPVLDETISPYLKDWTIARLLKTDRRKESRVQAFQTLFQLEMKDSDLTINEAISFIK
ncbi:transcription antitermination factor NusB, partial [Staphylococcus aureus]